MMALLVARSAIGAPCLSEGSADSNGGCPIVSLGYDSQTEATWHRDSEVSEITGVWSSLAPSRPGPWTDLFDSSPGLQAPSIRYCSERSREIFEHA